MEGLTGADAHHAWGKASVTRQRAVLQALGVVVTIERTRQGPGFDPNDVTLTARLV